jgi:hypothetical protein
MLLALSILAPATGRAEGQGNVQELLQDCQQPIVDIRHFFCLGIVWGVSDTMMTNASHLKMMPKDLARLEANFALCPDPTSPITQSEPGLSKGHREAAEPVY